MVLAKLKEQRAKPSLHVDLSGFSQQPPRKPNT
jgi:hypothetical protein